MNTPQLTIAPVDGGLSLTATVRLQTATREALSAAIDSLFDQLDAVKSIIAEGGTASDAMTGEVLLDFPPSAPAPAGQSTADDDLQTPGARAPWSVLAARGAQGAA